jgi:alpha-glucosidase
MGLVALLAALHITNATAENLRWQATSHGITIQTGPARLELAPATSAGLRLSVSYTGSPAPASSVFLAPGANSELVAWKTTVEPGNFIGIKTAAGSLLVNPVAGKWMLEDPSGKVLIPPAALGQLDHGKVVLNVGWPRNESPFVYGCGNGVATLEQTNAVARVGNGVAVIPYYWSRAGYAALAVAADDNQPASWRSPAGQDCGSWSFPGATADLYLMPAADLHAAAGAYRRLSGAAPVPPRWAFGYLQSRWGWQDKADIDDTLKHFLDLHLPVDAFIFDFEWYTEHPDYGVPAAGEDRYPDFGWNARLFPDPAGQIAALKRAGVHFVGIRKPRLGNKDTLAAMQSKGWALVKGGLKPRDGIGVRDMDFQDPGMNRWYQQQSAPLIAAGIDGWWNDEGEGSYTTYYYWNESEAEALAADRPGARLWTLNRAFSPGAQRLGAAAWTGDIDADWATFSRTPASLLNWSLAGMPYSACDIGGFNQTPSPELLARWMEAGVFFPIMRTHSTVMTPPHFPWLFGTNALAAIRDALDLRYRLIPYYYSLAHETHAAGLPVMRPLVMEFPRDPQVANLADQWLMGARLMAAPILTTNNQRSIYLPADDWYFLNNNQKLAGSRTITATVAPEAIPALVRAGTILPLAPVIQHTSELPGGPLEVQIYPGSNASFTLVEDDGQTTAYEQGQVRRTEFKWNNRSRTLTWKVEGPYHGTDIFKALDVKLFAPAGIRQAGANIGAGGRLTL